MALQDSVTEAWKSAMKARDPSKDVLALIRTEFKSEAINSRGAGESGTELDDESALKVLQRMAKQRRESITEYEKGGRDDLAEKEKAELVVIDTFLPTALSEDEVLALVDEVIAETGASSMKDMGRVMGPAMKKAGGRADGKAIQAAVKVRLGLNDLDQTLDEIRSRIDMGQVFGRHVNKIKKSGRQLMGLCPFHGEKTPSFSIDPERGLYHCFGCDARGNVFQFLERVSGQHFMDVVRGLAAETGVEIQERNENPRATERRKKRERQTVVLEKTQMFFRNALRGDSGRGARSYITKRQVDAAYVDRFGLGFGGSDPQSFLRFLDTEGISHDEAVDSGVLRINDRGPYPFFSQRLTFPIRNGRGHIVSFSARALGDRKPKYVNGPATEVFDKSRELYGLFEGQREMRRGKPAVLVEGQLDVIACHRAGATTAVAPCGTSLTESQVNALKKLTDRVILCLDDDVAGRKAAHRSTLLLLKAGLDVGLVELDGGDPDDLVNEGKADKLKTAIEGAPAALETFIARAKARAGLSVRARTQAIDGLMPFLGAHPREIVRREYIRRAAQALGEDETVLMQEAQRAARAAPRERPRPKQPEKQRAPAPQRRPQPERIRWRDAEILLVRALLAHPILVPRCGVLSGGLRNPELTLFISQLSEALVRHHALPPLEAVKKVSIPRHSKIFEEVHEMVRGEGFTDPERYFPFAVAARAVDDYLLFHDQRDVKERILEVHRALINLDEQPEEDREERHRLQQLHKALTEERQHARGSLDAEVEQAMEEAAPAALPTPEKLQGPIDLPPSEEDPMSWDDEL